MYEEQKGHLSIKDTVLQIILVVLFVFLLLWLFPTKGYVDNQIDTKLQPLYNQIFSENLNNMKEGAQSYFTTSRLPKNIGDKVTMTLAEMQNKKLVLPFLDSNNKQCSLTDSYIEITKLDDEYVMKVSLSCTDTSDYILVYMGCYNYCSTGLCEKQEVTPTVTKSTKVKPTVTVAKKNYEYEYELVINGKWGDWSTWSEWSEFKVDKTDYRNVKTKTETVQTGSEKVKVGVTSKYTDATAKTNYYCPNGYTLKGTDCTRSITSTDTKTASSNTTSNTTYSCPAGYTLNGTNCTKPTSSTSSINATASSAYTAWARLYYHKEYTTTKTTTSTTKYTFISSRKTLDCSNSCKTITYYTYDVYTRKLNTTYSCPSGYTRSGTKCNKTVYGTDAVAATPNTTSNTTYSCPSGYTLNGTTCSKQITTNQSYASPSDTTYSCKSGTLSGNKCITYEDKYETFPTYSEITYYSYQTRTYISGDRKTVWSKSQNDSTLINQGYSLTGKYREI